MINKNTTFLHDQNNDNTFQFDLKDEFEAKLHAAYKISAPLGKGGFSKVVSMIEKQSGILRAVKILDKERFSHNTMRLLKNESKILSACNHPNIISYYKTFESTKRIFMVLEHCEGQNLNVLAKKILLYKKTIDEVKIRCIITKLLKTVSYLHEKNIIHRDIKLGNILLAKKNDYRTIKLADFGLSIRFDSQELVKSFNQRCGTLTYMAPELIKDQMECSKSVDIWAVGILMALLLNDLKHPFIDKSLSNLEMQEVIISGNHKLDDIECSPMAKHLQKNLLQYKSSDRYTADEAIDHPWITGNSFSHLVFSPTEIMMMYTTSKEIKQVFQFMKFLSYIQTYNTCEQKLENNSCNKADKVFVGPNKSFMDIRKKTSLNFSNLNLENSAESSYEKNSVEERTPRVRLRNSMLKNNFKINDKEMVIKKVNFSSSPDRNLLLPNFNNSPSPMRISNTINKGFFIAKKKPRKFKEMTLENNMPNSDYKMNPFYNDNCKENSIYRISINPKQYIKPTFDTNLAINNDNISSRSNNNIKRVQNISNDDEIQKLDMKFVLNNDTQSITEESIILRLVDEKQSPTPRCVKKTTFPSISPTTKSRMNKSTINANSENVKGTGFTSYTKNIVSPVKKKKNNINSGNECDRAYSFENSMRSGIFRSNYNPTNSKEKRIIKIRALFNNT